MLRKVVHLKLNFAQPMPGPAEPFLLSISKASSLLGVSPDTLRRLEAKGQIKPKRSANGDRLFSADDITLLRQVIKKPVAERSYTIQEASNILSVSPQTIRRWDREGKISPNRTPGGQRIFTLKDIQSIQNASKAAVQPKQTEAKPPVTAAPPSSPPADILPFPMPGVPVPKQVQTVSDYSPPETGDSVSNNVIVFKKKRKASKYVPFLLLFLLLIFLIGLLGSLGRRVFIFPRGRDITTIYPTPTPAGAPSGQAPGGIGGIIKKFTEGSVIFQGDDQAGFSENNENFFWDNTNFFLGIGTDSPSAGINVEGRVSGTGLLLLESQGNDYIIRATDSGLNVFEVDSQGNVDIAGTIGDINDSTLNVKSNLATGGDISVGGGDLTASSALKLYSTTSTTLGLSSSPTTVQGSIVYFDDTNLTSTIKLTNTATALPNGNTGIVDAIVDAYNHAGSSSQAFSSLTSGTNTQAAMIVGSGASLTYSGTGTITASDISCTGCIANSDLANSSITFAGDSGSSAISLGGTLNIVGAGNVTTAQSGSTLTITGSSTITADSLDFTEFADAMTLDAATDIATAGLTLSTSGTGALDFASTGQVTFAGNVDLDANVVLGDAITDTITFTGRVAQDSDLIPIGTTGTNTLGTALLPWDEIYGVILYQGANQVCDSGGTGCPASFGVNYWQLNTNVVSPSISAYDVAVGGTATASAKFQAFGAETATSGIAKITSTVTTTGDVLSATSSAITSGNLLKLGTGGDGAEFTGNGLYMDFDNTGGASFTGNFLKFDNAQTTRFTIDASGRLTTIDAVAHTVDDVSGDLTLTSNSTSVAVADDLAVNGATSADITTTTTTATVFNTTATTLSIGGVATAIDIGATTGTTSINNALAVDGDTTLGDAITDNITFTARVAEDSDLIPIGTTGTNTLGTSLLPWDEIYGVILYQGANQVCDTSGNCTGSAIVKWRENLGTLSPYTDTLDVLIGSTATTSAKFAFKNVLTGVPTASISGTTANVATFIDGNGNISTTNRADLVIGNSSTYDTTGDILINPNGTGDVGIGISAPSTTLHISDSAETILRLEETDGGADITFGRPGTSTYDASIRSGVYNGSDIVFFDGSTARMTLSNGGGLAFGSTFASTDPGDSNVIIAGSVGVGDSGPDVKLEVLSTTEQLRLTNVDGTTDARFTVSSTGDLTIDMLGSGSTDQLILSGDDVINIGGSGSTEVAYNVIGDSTTGASVNVDSDDDLYIEGNLEVDGTLYGVTIYQGANQVCDSGGTGCPASFGVNYWQLNTNVVSPSISAYDVAVGGTATASAKFQAFAIEKAADATSRVAKLTSSVITTGVVLEATASAITSGNMIKLGTGGDSAEFTGNGLYMDFDNTGGASFTGNFLKFDNAQTTRFTIDASGRLTTIDAVAHTIDDVSGDLTLTSNSTSVAVADDLAVNGATSADITTTTTTATVFNTTATTLSIGGAATTAFNIGTGNSAYTAINIGTGTGGNVFNIGTNNTTKDTINIGSALDDVIISGAGTGSLINFVNFDVETDGDIVTTGDIAVNGDTITSDGELTIDATSKVIIPAGDTLESDDLTSAGALTLTSTGAGNDITLTSADQIILNSTGTIELQDDTNIAGDLGVNGATSADITSTTTTASLFNATVLTLNIGGAATAIDIGATTGTTSINNSLAVDGDTTLGDAITDNITFTARVAEDSDLIPIGTTGTNTLGTSLLPWDEIYGVTIYQGGNQVCDITGTGCHPSFGVNYWQLNTNVVSPSISAYDVAVGGTATASAKFQAFGAETATSGIAKLTSTVTTTGNVLSATSSAITSGNMIKLGTGGDAAEFTGNGLYMDFDNTGGASFTGNFLKFDNATSTVFTVGDNGAIQAGTFSGAVDFSRLGSATSGHGLAAAYDLLITGKLELDDTLFLDAGTVANSQGDTAIQLSSVSTTAHMLTGTNWLVENPTIENGGNPGQAALMVNQKTAADLFVVYATGSAKFTIQNDGDVGIGTTTPESILEIQGAEGLDATLTLDADDGDDATDTWFIESEAADNDLSIVNDTTELAKLTSTGVLAIYSNICPGNGGIQTTTCLGYNGTLLTAAGLSLSSTLDMNGQRIDEVSEIQVNSDALNIEATDGNDKFRFLTSTGSLYIGGAGGNTDPTAVLDVNGDARFLLGATHKVLIDAAATDSTGTAGALDIDLDATSSQQAINLDIETITDSAIDTMVGLDVLATQTSTDDDVIYGIRVQNLAGTPDAGAEYAIYQAGTSWDYGLYVEDRAYLATDVGIGVAAPDNTLDVAGSFGGASSATFLLNPGVGTTTISTADLVYNVEVDDSAGACDNRTINITGVPSTEGSFVFIISRYGDAGCSSGTGVLTMQINGVQVSTVACANCGTTVIENYLTVYSNGSWKIIGTPGTADSADLAEWIQYAGAQPQPGALLSVAENALGTKLSSLAYDPKLIGVVTTNPSITMGDGSANEIPMALAGRVPAIVTTNNGNILNGDPITSSYIDGVGMKSTKPGNTVGKALESTANWSQANCPAVDSIDQIVWPEDDGSNQNHPCFALPDGTIIGKIMVFINVSWVDPEIQVADLNGISIGPIAQAGGQVPVPKYQVTQTIVDGITQVIDRIGVFGQLIAANIKAGAVETKELATDSFTAFQGTVDNILISSGLVAGNIKTSIISPIPEETDLTLVVGSEATPEGKLQVQNTTGAVVASIDNEGNASFSGTVRSTNIDDIQSLLADVQTDQDILNELISSQIASSSADLGNIVAGNLYITGQAAINSLSVTESLSFGTDFVIDVKNSSINSLVTPLSIQNLALAPVEIMGGLVRIETNGNVSIAGDLKVEGTLSAAKVSLGGENKFQNVIEISNSEGAIIASIDASGSALFEQIQSRRIVGSDEQRGSFDIVPGEDAKTVEKSWNSAPSVVLAFPSYDTKSWVVDISEKGFTIRVSDSPADAPQKVYWWAIW